MRYFAALRSALRTSLPLRARNVTLSNYSRFPLMRYFAAASLVVIVLLIAGAGLLVDRNMRNALNKQAEAYAISVAQYLNADLHHVERRG